MGYYYTIIGLMLLNSIIAVFTWVGQTVKDPEHDRFCTLTLAGLFLASFGWMLYAVAYDLNSGGSVVLTVVITLIFWVLLYLERQVAKQPPPEKSYPIPPR